ncbi:ATP-binding cassette sub-family C member 4 isoform X3 [Leptinotarsa decemlineata]|uniref:ATP-binding cassette sub-family C member 4 isoform X3 n=1 Tax=Leptinotarsa decemlineata TaxID=7539 RepID=UPI003D3070D4
MDVVHKLKADNPHKKANVISKIFFWWMNEIIRKCIKTGLQVIDLHKPLNADGSKILGDKLEKNWEEEIIRAKSENCKPSLLRALSKTFLLIYMLWGFLFFLQFGILRCIQPIILSILISLFTGVKEENTQLKMYLSSAALVGSTTFLTFIMHHTNFGLATVGMRIRVAVSSMVYRKITRLNIKSLGETDSGKLVNLLSNDVSRFDYVVLLLHALWVLPFQVTLITFLLWQQVQISALVGIMTMAVVGLPLQGYLGGKVSGKLRKFIAEKTDFRVKVMSEVISGIQVIKMYTWEKSFKNIIKAARLTEISDITKSSYVRGMLSGCMVFLDKLTLFMTVICYVLLGNVITADRVFSMAQLFSILQTAMAIHYPIAMSMGSETRISISRVQAFMLLGERETSDIEMIKEKKIELRNVSASWTSSVPTLKNISLQIKPGTLCAIIGPVGSGKSSLLQGKIEAQGNFEDLSKSELDFTKILGDHKESDKPDAETTGTPNLLSRTSSILSLAKSQISEHDDENECNLAEEEARDPTISPIKEYIKATKTTCGVATLIIMMVVAQGLCAGADYWVSFWTDQERIRHSEYAHVVDPTTENTVVYHLRNESTFSYNYKYEIVNNDTESSNPFGSMFESIEENHIIHKLLKTNYAMYIYGFLIVFAVILTLTRSFTFNKLCMLSSTHLHSNMFHSLLNAPMRFFDTTPSGKILNRFSKDMGAIDETLPRVMLDAIQIFLVMCGNLVNIGVTNPYMIIAMVLLGLLFLKIRQWFISTMMDIRHLESLTKSPVFSQITATLKGIETIRASKIEKILIQEFDDHQDIHTSAFHLSLACTYCFGLWLDILCLIFTACVSFSFVYMYSYSSVSGSSVGLALSQSLVLTGLLQFGMKATADVVQQLTSVERVLQYSRLDCEGPFETPQDSLLLKIWPTEGHIQFKCLSLRYVENDPPVLNDVNFVIQPGEKIGIVGRTGAGKSSLITALFRLAPIEGSIFIDGVDTKTIGLSELRKNISIIPQEPVLFSESLRYNLDPFGEFEDDELWKALDEVELREAVSSLDFMFGEGGNNFSLGQKQLICLARAILRNNKILVLDEATANVDERTDSFIQATIRKKFKDCTVLTIAHRLNTIMDSDKVIVMSFGHVLEFDHPHNLLQIPHGHFHKMLLETGPSVTSRLKQIAEEAYANKQVDS